MPLPCHQCRHVRSIPGDAHVACAKPCPTVVGAEHGVRNGWFLYPFNFDPGWGSGCTHFESVDAPVEQEQDWYFTFGSGQAHPNGYIRIRGTFASARAAMFEIYGDKWSFQYDSKEGDRVVKEWNMQEVRP